jgi:hypothetical protein
MAVIFMMAMTTPYWVIQMAIVFTDRRPLGIFRRLNMVPLSPFPAFPDSKTATMLPTLLGGQAATDVFLTRKRR